MLKSRCFILAALTLLAPLAQAATIDVGNHFLIPNQAGQVVQIMVSGSEQVSGLNFFAQIGDGGPELSEYGLPPGTDAPGITAVDLQTDTIFDDVAGTQSNISSIPQFVNYSFVIGEFEDPVDAEGILATLVLDTTGFSTGTWDFLLADVLADEETDTNFAPMPINILNGTISIAIGGDCNLDGRVDETDVTILAANWKFSNSLGPPSGNDGWTRGDFNGDGRVNNLDATILAGNWLQTPASAATAIPEPTAVVLLAMVLLSGTAFLRPRQKTS